MFCKTCGNQIPDGSVNCPSCGAAQVAQQYQQPAQQYQQPVQQYQQAQQPAQHVPQTRINPGFMILSILVPAVGIIMGIINLCKKNTRPGRAYLIAGCVSSFVWTCLYLAIIMPAMIGYVEATNYYY